MAMKIKSAIFILLLACLLSCEKDRNYADIYENMRVEVLDSDLVPADSVSTARIKVTLEEPLKKGQHILISTSHGVLYAMPYQPSGPGAGTLDLTPFSDETEVLLKAATLNPADPVYVSATIDNFTKSATLRFVPALPEDMSFAQDTFLVDSGEDVTLLLSMYLSSGFVSNGMRVDVNWNLESGSTHPDSSLLFNLPEYVFTSNKTARIPVDIIRHSPGARLGIVASTVGADNGVLQKRALLWFQ